MQKMDYDSATQTHFMRFEGKLMGPLCQQLAGEVDAAVKKELAENPGAKFAFDLSKVHFVASAFLRICLATARQLPNGSFRIASCKPEIKRIFSIAGMDKVIDIA